MNCKEFIDHRFIAPLQHMNYVVCRLCGDEIPLADDEYVGLDGGLYANTVEEHDRLKEEKDAR